MMHTKRRPRSTVRRLVGYVQAIANQRRRLANAAAIYHDQLIIYPLQIEASQNALVQVRHLANTVRTYLTGLTPVEAQRIQPFGCITKLGTLDYLLTEILLNIAMFGEVCLSVSPDRVQVHMTIRSAFPSLLTCYDDVLSQLTALIEKIRSRQEEQGEEQIPCQE